MKKLSHNIYIFIITILLILLYFQSNHLNQGKDALFQTEFTLTNIPEEDRGITHFLQKAKEQPNEENLEDLYYYLRNYDYHKKSLIVLKQDNIDPDLYYEYQQSINGWDFQYIRELANKDSLIQNDIKKLNDIIDIWINYDKELEKFVVRGQIKDSNKFTELTLQLNNKLTQVLKR